jgi:hypothetical protein
MKTLKITLALVAVLFLTVSGVKSEDVSNTSDPTYKEYNNMDLLAVDKTKLKLESHG